jgi:FkbM family methyltransferase
MKKMIEKTLSVSIFSIGRRIQGLQIREEAGHCIRRSSLAFAFVPLYGLFRLLVCLHGVLYGPLRSYIVCRFEAIFTCILSDMVQRYIHLFGIWEPNITRVVQRRLSAGDIFVDVGANVGYYSIMASKLVGESGHVVAIEPSLRIFEMLKTNIALNDCPKNITAINMAVSEATKDVDVYAGPENNLGMTTTRMRTGFRWEARVPGANLSDTEVCGCTTRHACQNRYRGKRVRVLQECRTAAADVPSRYGIHHRSVSEMVAAAWRQLR